MNINNNISSQTHITFSSSLHQKSNEIPSCLKQILALNKNSSFDDIYNAVDNNCNETEGFKKIKDGNYKYGKYYIKITTSQFSDQSKYVMENLTNKGIDIAPKYVGHINTNEGFSVFVYSVDGTEQEDLKPYNEVKNIVTIEEKQHFMDNIKKLVALGIGNYQLFDNENIEVTPDIKHRIICSEWGDLYPITTEAADIIDKFNKKLF